MRRMFRSLLWMATVAAIVRPIAAQQASALPRPTVGSIERLDPALDALIAPDAPIEQLAIGFEWSEGPVWRSHSRRTVCRVAALRSARRTRVPVGSPVRAIR